MEENEKEFEEENLEMIQQHKKTNKHRKKGFTLVEILAVIIILGVLMIIAIPAVTKNISESKSTTYITTVNKMMDTAMADVSAGDYSVGNKDITYYIPTSCLDIENKRNESPYGKFVKSYVVVTYNGEKNDYYFTGIDESGHGILLTYRDKLSEDSIKTDLVENDINTLIGVGERNQIVVYSDSCDKTRTKDDAITNIQEHGELGEPNPSGGSGGSGGNTSNIVCKKATTLRTATCTASGEGCFAAGYTGSNSTITFGTLVNGTPKPGDAYDCKVSLSGNYTERFYYIGSDGENSILIYSKNMNNQTTYQYDSSNKNIYGPRTAYQYLPSTSEWNNPLIIAPSSPRNIVNQNGGLTTDGGTIESFTYTGKAARFLTYQEVEIACGKTSLMSIGSLDSCNWLLDNIGEYEDSYGSFGYWLETPTSYSTINVWMIGANKRFVANNMPNTTNFYGVRPVITINTSSLEA